MQPAKRGDVPRLIGRTKGGLNSKLHAVCDGEGRPVRLLLTEGQQSDHKGAATLLADLPSATEMLGDKGYDSDAYRAALVKRARYKGLALNAWASHISGMLDHQHGQQSW